MTSGNSEARKRAEEQAQAEQMHRSRIAGEQAAIRFAGRELPALVDPRGSILHALVHLRAACEELEKELRHGARMSAERNTRAVERGIDSHPVYAQGSDCVCGRYQDENHKPGCVRNLPQRDRDAATDVLGSVLRYEADQRALREAIEETEAVLADPKTMAAIEEAQAELDEEHARRLRIRREARGY